MKAMNYNDQGYTNEPIGEVRIIADFLPSPEALVFKTKQVKVTLALDASTLDFFKQKASAHNDKYQRMIRLLLREYAAKHGALAIVKQ
jgi:predicted DNA binding CopG/RHH family protein